MIFFDLLISGLSNRAGAANLTEPYRLSSLYLEPIAGIEALSAYVGMFSANAPGWSATVVKSDTISDITRITVAFGGMGPDGNSIVQHGQYFVEHEGDLVSGMVGFVGTGEPE